MMSLNRADELRRDLEEKHGFNAEQANGTLMVVDEMVETGFDRMLKSIADSESRMTKEMASLRSEMDKGFVQLRSDTAKDIASLRTEMGKDIGSLRSDMDARFKSVDSRFTLILALLPLASAVTTIILIAALAAIFGDAQNSVSWLIPI